MEFFYLWYGTTLAQYPRWSSSIICLSHLQPKKLTNKGIQLRYSSPEYTTCTNVNHLSKSRREKIKASSLARVYFIMTNDFNFFKRISTSKTLTLRLILLTPITIEQYWWRVHIFELDSICFVFQPRFHAIHFVRSLVWTSSDQWIACVGSIGWAELRRWKQILRLEDYGPIHVKLKAEASNITLFQSPLWLED